MILYIIGYSRKSDFCSCGFTTKSTYLYCTQWDIMRLHDTLWDIMGHHEMFWDVFRHYETLWDIVRDFTGVRHLVYSIRSISHYERFWDVLIYLRTLWDNLRCYETYWDTMNFMRHYETLRQIIPAKPDISAVPYYRALKFWLLWLSHYTVR